MDIVDIITHYLRANEDEKKVPTGYCPNCWGRQEYEGEFFDALKNEQVDLKNAKEKRGWINAYAAKYLNGIRLIETEDGMQCPGCKLKYKKGES